MLVEWALQAAVLAVVVLAVVGLQGAVQDMEVVPTLTKAKW
jgi:hypothetical protein